jgi:hypothetical protein
VTTPSLPICIVFHNSILGWFLYSRPNFIDDINTAALEVEYTNDQQVHSTLRHATLILYSNLYYNLVALNQKRFRQASRLSTPVPSASIEGFNSRLGSQDVQQCDADR